MTEQARQFGVQEWQRLSPMSIVFFIGKFVTHLIKDSLPSLAPVAIVIFNSENKAWITSLIAIAAVVLLLGGSFLQYWYFKFKIEGEKLLVNDGVFKKNHRIIQFDRIQNINILQPLYFKPFQLVNLQVETAGAKGNEADLAGIPGKLAEYLREHVMQAKQHAKLNVANTGDTEADHLPELIAEASMRDLVNYGMSSNGIFWFFVLIAPIFSMTDEIIEKWITKEDINYLADLFGGGIAGNIVLALSAILLTLALMFSFSILGAILRYYKYQLTINSKEHGQLKPLAKQTLKRSSGLLTSYQESLKLQKIQAFISQSNFIGRWLKVENITLGQVSSGQNTPKNRASLFVVPARTSEQSSQLKSQLMEAVPGSIETVGIDKRYVYKTLALKLFLPSLIICTIIYLNVNQLVIFAVPVLISLIFLPLVLRRWRAYQFGMKKGYARFERGLFGFRHVTFPLFKVQKVEVIQSPLQRRRDLATLKVYLASNKIQMQYIPMKTAQQWMAVIVEQIQQTKKAWY
ncbi:MAG: PH domain-containing protein [Kangiellaceae bacterium]